MSTPAEQVASPLQQPTSAATDFQALQFFIEQRLRKVQTAIVVKVVNVNAGGVGPVGTVDVVPLVDQVDGAGNVVPHVTIYGRPYSRIQGGTNAFILDPQVGDLGLMVFCSRDISSVISSKQNSPPASARIFNYADGLYLGGYLNGTPQNYIRFEQGGTIDIVAPALNITTTGSVNINGAVISHAGEVTDALGKVLGTHRHSGVQGGSSNTGPPV